MSDKVYQKGIEPMCCEIWVSAGQLTIEYCPRHAAADALYEALRADEKRLKDAFDAIESLPIGILGDGHTSDGQRYPLRDELLHYIAQVIKKSRNAIALADGPGAK